MASATKRLMACLAVAGILVINGCDAGFVVDPVNSPENPAFSLSPSEMTLGVGDRATIVATIVRANGQKVNPNALKWDSSEPKHAAVDREGIVTGVAPGLAAIVASSGNMADTTWLRVVAGNGTRAGVDISPDTVVLRWINATAALSAEVRDAEGTLIANPGVTWKSLNPGIAQTDNMGVVTAKGAGVALIVATAVCCDRADTSYARIQQVVDSVAIGQPSLSLTQGSSTKLSPVALDRGGAKVDNASFTFKSANESVARVRDDGTITTHSVGTTTVTAYSGDHSDRVTVNVTQGATAGPSAGRPNEPAGFVPWFVHDWQSFPSDTDECVVPASGVGFMVFCGVTASVNRGTLIDDPNAPHGFGKSIRVHWPKGFSVGSGFFNYAIRSTERRTNPDRVATSVPLQKWYISTWVYLEPNANGNWEMQFDQLRHFTGNRHITAGSEDGQTLFGWTFRGGQSPWTDFGDVGRAYRLWGYPSPDGSSTSLASPSPGIPVGEWVHMELLFDRTVKSPPLFGVGPEGTGPVAVKFWQNGRLVMDVVETWHMSHPFMELFFNLNQSGGISPSTDRYMRLSGTYISGEIYTGN